MRILALAVLAVLSSCTTIPAVSSVRTLDPKTADQCKAHCDSLGMDLGAIVLIRSSAGCVCEPRGKSTSDAGGSSAVTAGAAVQMIDEQVAGNRDQSRH
jgi:hypothetical protein